MEEPVVVWLGLGLLFEQGLQVCDLGDVIEETDLCLVELAAESDNLLIPLKGLLLGCKLGLNPE